ncbi:hypothetical protein [Streptomyces sp. NBRC 110035]|uniref:hypothetical protein n=1 Tax=Streptomyces sp. NBRC 110035 TaxID=1547867 RepID=UPI0005A6E069|nr:hypothetical protein [Streptomyces sp. NBRC 110035]
MSAMTPETTNTSPADSYNDGLIDGELAAITHLPSARIHARAAMADEYDPLYAQGLIDGYLHAIAVNAALIEKEQTA